MNLDLKRRDVESQLWDYFFFSFCNGRRGGSLSPQDCLAGSVAMVAYGTVLEYKKGHGSQLFLAVSKKTS